MMRRDVDNNCALIVLYDLHRRYLLQLRSNDAPRLPGYWGFFGGGINISESPLQAVCREALEELRYELVHPTLFFQQPFELSVDQQRVQSTVERGYMWAFTEILAELKTSIQPSEGADYLWATSIEIKKLKMLDHDRNVISALDNYLDKSSM